jgi:hypothetical protein
LELLLDIPPYYQPVVEKEATRIIKYPVFNRGGAIKVASSHSQIKLNSII